MIGSDSLGLSHGPGPHPGHPHPRMYGTFPRVIDNGKFFETPPMAGPLPADSQRAKKKKK